MADMMWGREKFNEDVKAIKKQEQVGTFEAREIVWDAMINFAILNITNMDDIRDVLYEMHNKEYLK